MKFVRSVLFIGLIALLGCNEAQDISSFTEYSCDTATGLWTIKSIKCNSETISSTSLAYYLFSENQVFQTVGTTACARTYNWNFLLGVDEPSANFSGQGSWSCTSNGATVSSCSDVLSCNDQIPFEGAVNNFSQCVVTERGMTLTRSVSAINNPDNLAHCEYGQEEELFLVKATNINLDPVVDLDPEEPQPILTLQAPNPIDFGTLYVDSQRSLTYTLVNNGNAQATAITAIGLQPPFTFLGGSFPGAGGTCTQELEAEQSCTIVLNFLPRDEELYSQTLQLTYSGGTSQQSLTHAVLGTGSRNLGLLLISDGVAYDFGAVTVGSTKAHTFTITNTGGGIASELEAIDLTQPFGFVGGTYPGTAGTCGASLAPGATCDIQIEFSPSTVGSVTETIQIQYSDGYFIQTTRRNIFGSGQ